MDANGGFPPPRFLSERKMLVLHQSALNWSLLLGFNQRMETYEVSALNTWLRSEIFLNRSGATPILGFSDIEHSAHTSCDLDWPRRSLGFRHDLLASPSPYHLRRLLARLLSALLFKN